MVVALAWAVGALWPFPRGCTDQRTTTKKAVMPLDVLGRTRATLTESTSCPASRGVGNLWKLRRDGDRSLQLSILNEEFLVSVIHQIALITSLPFVHTARQTQRAGT